MEPQYFCGNVERRTTGFRPCTHEQIKYRLFARILTYLLHSDPKLAQIKVTLFAHVYAALEAKNLERRRSVLSFLQQFTLTVMTQLVGSMFVLNHIKFETVKARAVKHY